MGVFKRCLLGVGVILLALQFLRPVKNRASGGTPQDISNNYTTPPPVQAVLKRACYDCHSDNTRYPWYAEVQPLGWWLNYHVQEGKKHLNFSAFGGYAAKRAERKLEEIVESITTGEMPLSSYTWVHSDARLTAAEIKLLSEWSEAVRRTLPVD